MTMNVSIVIFPQTRVASISHIGSPSHEHDTARKLIEWKIQHRLLDQSRFRSYGLHYADPRTAEPSNYRVDFCLSIESAVAANQLGIVEGTIPSLKCALARDVGSRTNNKAARYLYDQWLPQSGERMADHPVIFHYVNVGPSVTAEEAITDVYLPLR
jgi:AraC family transcriptional regulator